MTKENITRLIKHNEKLAQRAVITDAECQERNKSLELSYKNTYGEDVSEVASEPIEEPIEEE